MRKFFYLIILVFAGLTAWNFFGELKTQESGKVFSMPKAPSLSDIKKEISTPGGLRGSKTKNSQANLTRTGTILATNSQRVAQGFPPLKENYLLNQAAQKKVKDMFEGQYFEHISPQGKGPGDLAKEVNYEFIAVGENLALGNYKNDTELVDAWMNSPGHRANILNDKFTEIGVAVSKGVFEGQETWLAVQEFGKPASACPKIDSNLKSQIESLRTELDNLETQVMTAKNSMDSLGKDLKTQEDYENYNRKVSEYNAVVRLYNNKLDNLKSLTDKYNLQVNSYNNCLN